MGLNGHPKVFIITPIYNARQYTLKFLHSIRQVNYRNFEVIIVDDGSTDGSAEAISEEFPEVIILRGDGTLWWSGGTNMGVKEALRGGTDYILTLNNDVEVDENFLTELVKCAEENPRSIVGSKIYYKSQPNRIWQFGTGFSYLRGLYMIGNSEIDRGQFSTRMSVKTLTGMSILINTNFFQDIGFFDNRHFPQYMGDSDFISRAYERGYKIIVEPNSKVWGNIRHTGSRISRVTINSILDSFVNLKSYANFRTLTRFYWRHHPIRSLFIFPIIWTYLRHFAIIGAKLILGDSMAGKLKEKTWNLRDILRFGR